MASIKSGRPFFSTCWWLEFRATRLPTPLPDECGVWFLRLDPCSPCFPRGDPCEPMAGPPVIPCKDDFTRWLPLPFSGGSVLDAS
jgi:hypothetical protein